jgi:DNA-binding beta-propeller fold protein YncE
MAMAQQEESVLLELEVKIPLGTVRGRIDHLAVDPVRKRVFIAELANNSLGIVDLNSARLLRRIADLNEPQGVAYVPQTDTVFVANGGDGTVRLFRGEDFVATARLELDSGADNIRVGGDPVLVYVGYGSGALAVIDPFSGTKRQEIALATHPESFQISRSTRQIFVNLPDAQSIAVIAPDERQQPEIWPVGRGRRGNFAMALDEDNRHLIVVFRTPPKLGVLDMRDRAPIAERDTCGDVDDVLVDSRRQRIYVICGAGFIDVFEARAAYARLARIPTRRGARTALFSPVLDRLAVAIRASENEPAALWVFRPQP